MDKYRPSSLARLDYHKEQAAQLRNLVQCGDFPHLLVYGPSGAGKKTRIMCILRELYGVGVEKLRIEHQTITTPSKKKIEISTIASNYHLEVNPSDAGNSDRVVIQEMLKTVAQSQQLETSSQRDFKVVLLTEVDKLTKDAQHALRRTMEKYMSTCRLILCCNSTSKVIAPSEAGAWPSVCLPPASKIFAVYCPPSARRKVWPFLQSWLAGWPRSRAGTSGRPYLCAKPAECSNTLSPKTKKSLRQTGRCT